MFIFYLNISKMFTWTRSVSARGGERGARAETARRCVYDERYDLNVYLDLGGKGRKNKQKSY